MELYNVNQVSLNWWELKVLPRETIGQIETAIVIYDQIKNQKISIKPSDCVLEEINDAVMVNLSLFLSFLSLPSEGKK